MGGEGEGRVGGREGGRRERGKKTNMRYLCFTEEGGRQGGGREGGRDQVSG